MAHDDLAPRALVTSDKAILSGDPTRMHEIDLAILKEAGGIAISPAQAAEEMFTHGKSPEEPDARERAVGSDPSMLVPLTPEEFRALGMAANKVSQEAQYIARRLIHANEASYIRALRVGHGYSWRKIASRVEPILRGALLPHEHKYWSPTSNQLMGMALCERAAILRGENYQEDPWN